jgi:streptogramin lyase
LDQANNIYIARPNGHAVYKITQSGTTTSFSGDLGSSANCLAVDSSGNMYTNLANNTVVKITSGGATSTLSTTGSGTVGIAVDQNGNVYTANFSSNNITKITSGGVSSLFGTTISSPYAVKIGYDGSVFVSSSASNNVTRISPSGTSYTLGTTGSYPDGILISRSGDIYTANRNSNNVTKISKVGTPTTFGQYTGVLYGGSYDFASDTSGNIYTADKDSYSISKIDTSGNVSLFTTTGVYKPYYMISDASNNLYYSAQSSSLTFSLMKSTSVGATSTLASPAPSPARLARDSQGNIYMPDSSNNLVLKVSSIGATSSIKGIYQPTDITIDSSDNVYVKNSNTGYVTKVTPAGATTTYLTGATITGSIVTDSLGAVYTANNGNVSKIDNISGKPGAVSFSGTTNPKDIIVKSATSFLIGLGLGGIMKVDLGGAPTTVSTTSISTSVPSDYIILYKVKNSSGNIAMAQRTVKVIYPKIIDRYIPPTVNNVIQNPASIVFDSNNNMYFTGNCNVFKVDSGTNALSLVYTGSSNCGHGVLAVDTSDNVYLAQYPYMMSSGTIIKITPAGSASTFANLGLQPAQQADLLKDSSGNLYSVVGSGAYKITTGGVVTSFTIDASDQVVVATMDNLNNLYVGYRTDGKVFKRTSGGATSTVYTAGSQMLGMVSNNVTGDVYVLEAQKITKITALGGVSTVATVSDSFGTGLSFGDSSSSMLFTSNYKIDLTTGKTYSIGNLNYSSVIWIKYNAIDNKLYMATNSESSVLKLKIH